MHNTGSNHITNLKQYRTDKYRTLGFNQSAPKLVSAISYKVPDTKTFPIHIGNGQGFLSKQFLTLMQEAFYHF